MLKSSLTMCTILPVLPVIQTCYLGLLLLTVLTYWRQFHILFITLYVSSASCSFMHLTTLVSISVSLVSVSVSHSRSQSWSLMVSLTSPILASPISPHHFLQSL